MAQAPANIGPMQNTEIEREFVPQGHANCLQIVNKMYTLIWYTMNVFAVVGDLIFPLLAVSDPEFMSNKLEAMANGLSAHRGYSWAYLVLAPALYRLCCLFVAEHWNCPCLPIPVIGYSLISLLSGEVWSITYGIWVVILPSFIEDVITWLYFSFCKDKWLPPDCNLRRLHMALVWSYPLGALFGFTTFATETSLALMIQNGHPKYASVVCLMKSLKLMLEVTVGSTLGNNAIQLPGNLKYIKIALVGITVVWTVALPGILWCGWTSTAQNSQQFIGQIQLPIQTDVNTIRLGGHGESHVIIDEPEVSSATIPS